MSRHQRAVLDAELHRHRPASELLLDDSTRLADRARAAGVDVVLDVTAGVPHVFQGFAGSLDEAGRALDRAALFLTQHLGAERA